MRGLFVGTYRQNDGWGEGSRNIIKSLLTQNIDLQCAPLFLGGNSTNIDPAIAACELKQHEQFDFVLQHALPDHMVYDGSFGKNIGTAYFESGGWKHTSWPAHINLMDQFVVSTLAEGQCLNSSDISSDKVFVSGAATDITKYEKEYKGLHLDGLQDRFVFYFIGDWIKRKGLEKLVAAYFSEFGPRERVCLVIKTSQGMKPPQQLQKELQNVINSIKTSLRVQPSIEAYTQPVALITHRLSEEQLMHLHEIGDCFVMPSWGEAICYPMIDALGFGNQAIYTLGTGMENIAWEMGGSNRARGVNSMKDMIYVNDSPIYDLYTSNEWCMNPSMYDLKIQMRAAFESGYGKKFDRPDMTPFSFEAVGNNWMEIIKQ